MDEYLSPNRIKTNDKRSSLRIIEAWQKKRMTLSITNDLAAVKNLSTLKQYEHQR